MPLSKERNRERMRQFRLHAKQNERVVQPKLTKVLLNGRMIEVIMPNLDADGNTMPEEG